MIGFFTWRWSWITLLWLSCAALGLAASSTASKGGDDILLNHSELLDLFQNRSLTRALAERHSVSPDAVARAVSLAQEFSTTPEANAGDSTPVGRSRDADYGRQISELFSPLERITLRRQYWLELGADALVTAHVAEILQLRAEQLTRLKELREQFDRELQSEINSLPRVTADYFQQVKTAHREKKLAAMMKILSAEQRARWTELTEAKK